MGLDPTADGFAGPGELADRGRLGRGAGREELADECRQAVKAADRVQVRFGLGVLSGHAQRGRQAEQRLSVVGLLRVGDSELTRRERGVVADESELTAQPRECQVVGRSLAQKCRGAVELPLVEGDQGAQRAGVGVGVGQGGEERFGVLYPGRPAKGVDEGESRPAIVGIGLDRAAKRFEVFGGVPAGISGQAPEPEVWFGQRVLIDERPALRAQVGKALLPRAKPNQLEPRIVQRGVAFQGRAERGLGVRGTVALQVDEARHQVGSCREGVAAVDPGECGKRLVRPAAKLVDAGLDHQVLRRKLVRFGQPGQRLFAGRQPVGAKIGAKLCTNLFRGCSRPRGHDPDDAGQECREQHQTERSGQVRGGICRRTHRIVFIATVIEIRRIMVSRSFGVWACRL